MYTSIVFALLASSAVLAMPGGGGSGKQSSCITKSTCSQTPVAYTSIFSTPSTYVSTCVTSSPVTKSDTISKTYLTTVGYPQTSSSPSPVVYTVTETNSWNTWTEICTKTQVPVTYTKTKVETKTTQVPYTVTVYQTETQTSNVPEVYTTWTPTTEYKTITTEKPCTTVYTKTESNCATTTSWTTWGSGW